MATRAWMIVGSLTVCACSTEKAADDPNGTGGATSTAQCSEALLKTGTQSLAQALTAADSTKLPLAAGATYHENLQTPAFGQGIWAAPLKIAFQRDFLDVTICQSYSEIVVTETHPYVLGIRLTHTAGKISDVTSLVADAGDFHFDATAFLAATMAEDWSVIPEGQRPTREAAIAAGNAYFDSFNDTTIPVPYGPTCTRLEGTENGPCNMGLPPPGRVMVTERQELFDANLGTAVSIDKFRGLPDSHMFRMQSGLITHMHAVIICDPTCAPPAAGAAGMAGAAGAGGATAGAGGVGAGAGGVGAGAGGAPAGAGGVAAGAGGVAAGAGGAAGAAAGAGGVVGAGGAGAGGAGAGGAAGRGAGAAGRGSAGAP